MSQVMHAGWIPAHAPCWLFMMRIKVRLNMLIAWHGLCRWYKTSRGFWEASSLASAAFPQRLYQPWRASAAPCAHVRISP